jgi:hypothetical protein
MADTTLTASSPSLGITDLESLLNEAASVYTGEREFVGAIGGHEVRFVYILDSDASTLVSVRGIAQDLLKLTTPPPSWLPFWGKGLTADVAMRIAWAQHCKLAFRGAEKPLGTLDLLKFSRKAGLLFVLLTDQIATDSTGVLARAESEVIEALGEDLPPTMEG